MGKSAKNKQAALSAKMFEATEKQLERYNEEQKTQRKLLEKQKQRYRTFEFKNPYADMENQFADMENVYEDMTVDMRAADFQKEMAQQQQANILQSLRGAAGTSGIAGLAQAMANQGMLQARQISTDVARQERQNQMASRQAAMTLQQLERQGAGQADMTMRGGEAMVQQAEMARQATLLGVEYGGMAGANAGVQAAYANQMSAFGAQQQALGAQISGTQSMISTGISAKIQFACIPKGEKIDIVDGQMNIEDVKPGDIVIGYNGIPVKVLQKHEYLEDPKPERFYKIEFSNGSIVNTCDMHKINGIAAKDISKNVVSKEVYSGVEYTYDLLTEDLGYQINGIPVNSMVEEMAELITKLNNK
tara:strand:+ start:5096 stop:6181 length:1086 start_codon:yes stop_codon:yes gene_type:complete